MRFFGKFTVQVLVAIAVLICSRAALAVAHACGWYPEQQLANLMLAAPTVLQVELVMWGLLAFVTAILWLLIDYCVYGRNYADLWWRIRGKPWERVLKANKEPVVKNAPGVTWKKLKRGGWRAQWRASPRAIKLGFEPKRLQLFLGYEITEFDAIWVSDRTNDLQKEMDTFVSSKEPKEPSMEEILASIRRIIADDDATKKA